MLKRIVMALTMLLCGAAAVQAETEAEKQARLRKLLEEKFGAPQQQSRGLPSQRSLDKGDVYIIKPDGSVQRPAGPRSEVITRSVRLASFDADDRDGYIILAADDTATAPPADVAAPPADAPAPAAQAPAPVPEAFPAIPRRPTDYRERWKRHRQEESRSGRETPLIVKRNSYVIQLKPDVTGEEIDALITKYRLHVIRSVPSLGVLYVRVWDREGTPESTRGLQAEPKSVQAALEPKVILELRKDPSVSAAFVNSTIAPKAVPKRSGAKAVDNGNQFRWSWEDNAPDDGNWGIKVMRMPAVWTILDKERKAHPDRPRTRVTLLDSGFGKHAQIIYGDVWGGLPANPVPADCGRSHGTHVTGIIGAAFGQGSGIDGIVPNARIEAVPISRELLSEGAIDGVTDAAQQHVAFFMDAIVDLADYLDASPIEAKERRVVNVSLAYNWASVALGAKTAPTSDRVIRDQVRQHAKVLESLVNRVKDRVLFVAAAGNDSDGLAAPINAEYASPFGYQGTHVGPGFAGSPNIIVVEAKDRDGQRAAFSNGGGHVAAPGVDIMSTLASDKTPFGVCSGTSQAAPHVTALAAILFELDPTKKPAEIADIIKKSAIATTPKSGAPRVDALEAVLMLSPDYLRDLADLNGDGKVDAADLEIFKNGLIAIEEAKFGGQPISVDLNGDGLVDDYERCFPVIDLNGSGRASYDPADARVVGGTMRSDLDVLAAAWTDKSKDFATALKESGLDDLINVWQNTALVAAAPEVPVKAPCR